MGLKISGKRRGGSDGIDNLVRETAPELGRYTASQDLIPVHLKSWGRRNGWAGGAGGGDKQVSGRPNSWRLSSPTKPGRPNAARAYPPFLRPLPCGHSTTPESRCIRYECARVCFLLLTFCPKSITNINFSEIPLCPSDHHERRTSTIHRHIHQSHFPLYQCPRL